jgi:hypothetical protein
MSSYIQKNGKTLFRAEATRTFSCSFFIPADSITEAQAIANSVIANQIDSDDYDLVLEDEVFVLPSLKEPTSNDIYWNSVEKCLLPWNEE